MLQSLSTRAQDISMDKDASCSMRTMMEEDYERGQTMRWCAIVVYARVCAESMREDVSRSIRLRGGNVNI